MPSSSSMTRMLAAMGLGLGAGGPTRTGDLLITNQLLYQLSYTSGDADYTTRASPFRTRASACDRADRPGRGDEARGTRGRTPGTKGRHHAQPASGAPRRDRCRAAQGD